MIITDLRILKHFEKAYNIVFDKQFKYCTKQTPLARYTMEYRGDKYRLKYFSGCFYPYLVKI